ncbi:MAG TPA: glycosyltransferase family 1 protein [Gammaproteobacteria bacterium]
MPKRIAFISEHASPLALIGGTDSGGQNVYVDRVARHLSRMGYEVDIFTRWDSTELPRVAAYCPGVRIIHVEAGPRKFVRKERLFDYMDDFVSDMAAFIDREGLGYEVMHAHFWMSGYVARNLKQRFGTPYAITFHALGKVRRIYQGSADEFPDLRFSIEEEVACDANAVIAECPQDRDDLMIHYFVKPHRIRTIPCGFDKDEFVPLDKRECAGRIGIDPDERLILQLGRMVPRKGIDNVIRGTAALLRKKPLPVRLLIVGGESDEPCPVKTPEIGRLQEIAREEGIEDKVTFTGRRTRDQLKYYYNAADIFVSTPWYEPFGITPLEAMACGVPVVGANVGGIKYSVEHDATGFLVPPDEPGILAERMLEILDDDRTHEALSRRAIRRVNRLFTWETVTQQLAELYEDITTDTAEAWPARALREQTVGGGLRPPVQ